MQNKGIVKVIALLLTLVCIFYLSFSFVTNHYESKAAAMGEEAGQEYLDSIMNQKVYLGTYSLKQCREMEIGLGLDLKGGMNVILEVSVPDVVMVLADYKKDAAFVKSMQDAKKEEETSQDDFISLFIKHYKQNAPGHRLAEIFATQQMKGKVILRVFKTIVDPFVGRLNMFKVVSGTLNSGMTLKDVNKENDEKISAIYYIKGKQQEPTTSVVAGDIGALAKLGDVTTGDTLTEDASLIFEPIVMPAPVYSMAVFAAKKGEEDKVFGGLSKLKDEDISFTVTKNAETNEMLLSGIGETQLSILCKKLKSKFGCEALLKEPRIAYRETVRKMAEAEGKHKKQSGGAGQFGDCWVRFEPGAEDGVYEFVDAVVGGAVPRQFIPAVDKGLREAIKEGVLAGYPMVNLKCTLFDGKYHPVDSKEIAFITAAKLAYQEGVQKASPCILEPIMHLEVTVPDSYMGDIMGDMNKRRGRILGTDQVDGKAIVSAEAPQSELAKYATDLRSMTQGRGRFKTEFARYEEVPPMAQDKIIKEAKERAAKE